MPTESQAVLSRRSLPGSSVTTYHDRSSGCVFVVARPEDQWELWNSYLNGARTNYRKHGVEVVLEYDEIADGRSTALFVVALTADGAVVGGMRMQGRYDRPAQAHAVSEWAGRPGTAELLEEISQRLPEGVIEMKSGWVSDEVMRREQLTNALARIFIHSMTLMKVRYVMGTVAAHAVKRWQTTGGVISSAVTPVAYPDERYRTVLMWWDRETFADLTVAEQLPFVLEESAQIAQTWLPTPSIPGVVVCS